MEGTLGRRAVGPPCGPTVPDVALAVLVSIGSLLVAVVGPPHEPGGRALVVGDWVVAVLAFVLIVLRHRLPITMLLSSAAAAVVATIVGDQRAVLIATTIIAVYTVASRTNRVIAWSAGGTTALVLFVTGLIWARDDPAIAVVAWVGMATAFGDAIRTRRAYVAAVEERARRAEETREEEARRRVAEERIRIARDLHDVVAHHIAVINVHAGLASHTLRTNPDRTEESLGHVQQAAQTVLDELATILTVLRQSDDGPAPTEPVRGLAGLGDLLESFATAGLRVGHQQVGDARPLPPAVDLAAYRIVQEALTNAHKHGTGATAHLRIEYRPDSVLIDVSNPAPRTPTRDGGGHGLTGMRERAIAVGGTFTAGPEAPHQFHVTAVLMAAPERESVP